MQLLFNHSLELRLPEEILHHVQPSVNGLHTVSYTHLNIRECDAIIHVLRCFDNGNIVHVDGSVDLVRDKEIIDTELQLKDLDTCLLYTSPS